ncbi:cob(I)yrinic acid a,c-diamide adenosyltransferase [Haloarchaeobius sp. DYHT-AS-18]|uniref:cob(I)yrinic acid a,c-diamide adenosyltransferase n=1 Tax=Haloarchaeobius sp. DYHT-AS-18 TaxID=3446117 RepID=UPI003EB96650
MTDTKPTDDSEAGDAIVPAAPTEFGLVQVFWGDGKGKTTAAMGMGLRAAGRGFRVHMLQFMKGGADSIDDAPGEYRAIDALPGFSYENTGHYGWHGFRDGSDEDDHAAQARAGLDRAQNIVDACAAADLSAPIPLDAEPETGVHMLILDEIVYAGNRGLIDTDAILDLLDSAPDSLELVLTGGHEDPSWLVDAADLVTNVRKVKHPIEAGQSARKGTEY